ncbi:MAG: DNA-directed RNA polymerase subunit omega [Rickettsiales bacterium]|jgi:DNA-directed RNA polymerase subunit omega|nr:DNA-directed RNA polymerase subunit omega [Rickettsiales bacterium]
MARTTNHDTLPHVESRYELGMLATQRVRDLTGGAEPVVEKQKDKLTVVALREIATGKLDMDALRHEYVQSYKDAPAIDATANVESASENPELKELDAELESAIIEPSDMTDLDNELAGALPGEETPTDEPAAE